MRVLQVIPSLSPSSGGPYFAMVSMARALVALGIEVDVVATDDDGRGLRQSGVRLGEWQRREGFRVMQFAKQTEFYKVSLPMRHWLNQHAANYDLVHVNALFSFASTVGAQAARAAGVPYVIRPLGVLNQWGLHNRRRLFKRLSFRCVEQGLLEGAAAIQCTSVDEAREVAVLGFGAKACVLPLGIDLQPFLALPPAEEFWARFPETRGVECFLFLSRVNLKKGLDLLLDAFAAVRRQRPLCRLIIAGDEGADVPGYLESLRERAVALGIDGAVTWAGHLDGELRLACFAAARVFVLPSFSENFGIALLEAMAAGLPCIASDQVALAMESVTGDAVRVVPCDVDALGAAMDELMGDEAACAELGQKARAVALAHYSMQAMGHGLQELYARLVAAHA